MIVVDNPEIPWHGKVWAHLTCEAGDDLEMLHRFATGIGLQRSWFQDRPRHPHYDVTRAMRARAIVAGAVPLGRTEFIKRTTRDGKG